MKARRRTRASCSAKQAAEERRRARTECRCPALPRKTGNSRKQPGEMDSSGTIAKARRKAMQFENYADKYQRPAD